MDMVLSTRERQDEWLGYKGGKTLKLGHLTKLMREVKWRDSLVAEIEMVKLKRAEFFTLTLNPQAYLLLREREKAGVEPISKVFHISNCSNISSLIIFHHRTWLILRSCWPTCPLMRSWRRRGWWSTSKWPEIVVETDLRWSTPKKVDYIYRWYCPSQHFEWFQDVQWRQHSARDIHTEDSRQWRLWFFRYI